MLQLNKGYMNETTVIIADSHAVFRKGLLSTIHEFEGYRVIGETDNGKQLTDMVLCLQPKLLIADEQLETLSGTDALHQLNLSRHLPPAIVISSHPKPLQVLSIIRAGALGIIQKNISIHELVKALDTVASGMPYFSVPDHTRLFMVQQHHTDQYPDALPLFTEKELQIIHLIMHEYSNSSIAKELSMSIKTVEAYRHRIYLKAGVKTAVGLSAFFYRLLCIHHLCRF